MNNYLLQSHTELTRKIIKERFIVLYEKKGVEKITVSEICQACGVSRSTFYQHFDDKYNLLENIENDILRDLKNLNLTMPNIKIKNTDAAMPLWEETATYISNNRHYIRPLICSHGDALFVHKWKSLIREEIKRRLVTDKVEGNLDMISYVMATASIGLYEYWFQYEPELSPRRIAEIGTQLLYSSFYRFSR